MAKFKVEYNLKLDLGVGSGWHAHDPEFDTLEEATEFKATLAGLDRNSHYRVVVV
jgi:hypothetical protein